MWTHKNLLLLTVASTLFGCTKTVPSQFKLEAANDSVAAGFEVVDESVDVAGAPVDILWVVDNSASMEPSQKKLRAGLSTFATKFLRKGTDIQLGVITTDAFVAHPDWQKYLNTPIPSKNKTPIQIRKEQAQGQPVFGPQYATLNSSGILRTKNTSTRTLIDRFQKKVSVGIRGIYEERGFGSVSQFLADNEKADSKYPLFRPGSQRIIVFLSDENDQTVDSNGPEPRKLLYSGSYNWDPAVAETILPPHFTTKCQPSVVEGMQLAPMSVCLAPSVQLRSPETFKGELDAFFRQLDGSGPTGNPNYIVSVITAMKYSTVMALRKVSEDDAKKKGGIPDITHEAGDRYVHLANIVNIPQLGGANAEKLKLDIGADDYTPVLEQIGLEIVNRSVVKEFRPTTKFVLKRLPVEGERFEVVIVNAAGSRVLDPSQYSLAGNEVTITDEKIIKTLRAGDQVQIRYQPASVQPAKKKSALLSN